MRKPSSGINKMRQLKEKEGCNLGHSYCVASYRPLCVKKQQGNGSNIDVEIWKFLFDSFLFDSLQKFLFDSFCTVAFLYSKITVSSIAISTDLLQNLARFSHCLL